MQVECFFNRKNAFIVDFRLNYCRFAVMLVAELDFT